MAIKDRLNFDVEFSCGHGYALHGADDLPNLGDEDHCEECFMDSEHVTGVLDHETFHDAAVRMNVCSVFVTAVRRIPRRTH